MQKPVLLLSPNGDTLASVLKFPPGGITYGNYKDIVSQIRQIRQGKVSGVIVDANTPEEDLSKVISGLRQANIKHNPPEFSFILFGTEEKKFERVKSILRVEDVIKEFK
jgi:hypothetical protein